jgi:hypothetical protein
LLAYLAIVMLSDSEALVTQPVLPRVGRKAPSTLVILSDSEALVTYQVLPKIGRKAPSTLVILSVAKNWSLTMCCQRVAKH